MHLGSLLATRKLTYSLLVITYRIISFTYDACHLSGHGNARTQVLLGISSKKKTGICLEHKADWIGLFILEAFCEP